MIASPSRYQLMYGRDEPPEEPRLLRAGPVTAELVGRDLRNVRYGDLQIVQRIYVAMRDRNWDTVPAEISNLRVDQRDDGFVVQFDARHRQHDLDLSWRGEIVGAADGTISYAMDARANQAMTYKLIGLNAHHAMGEYAGRPFAAETIEGPVEGTFPLEVGPQLVVDQTEVPLFPPTERLTARLRDDVTVHFVFEGDTFEFEDQRNWTDGSFKSQSYPPRRNGFFHLDAGERVFQKVTVTVSGPVLAGTSTSERVEVVVGESAGQPLPPIGFGMASHGRALSPREADLLRDLRPDHLRVDLRLAESDWDAALVRAVADCRALGCGLELALFVSDAAAAELEALAARLREVEVPIRRILVFHAAELATAERWVALAREALRPVTPDALFAGGTNANFCELNRFRPERAPGDGIAYSINPQIHAFDERSLVENLAPQAETVATARAFGGGRPVVVGPVTLKQRFNAVATAAPAGPRPGELPPQVDPRQMSLFLAGWATGSVKYLASSGAASITYFETTGWRGVMERDEGSPEPELFPSRPGDVFPVYHVFADLAEWRGGEIVAAPSSDPLAVEALAIAEGDALHLLVANLTPREQQARVTPMSSGEVRLRRLNAETAPTAMADPRAFRASATAETVSDNALDLTLAPFEVVRIDARRPA